MSSASPSSPLPDSRRGRHKPPEILSDASLAVSFPAGMVTFQSDKLPQRFAAVENSTHSASMADSFECMCIG